MACDAADVQFFCYLGSVLKVCLLCLSPQKYPDSLFQPSAKEMGSKME